MSPPNKVPFSLPSNGTHFAVLQLLEMFEFSDFCNPVALLLLHLSSSVLMQSTKHKST